MSNGTTNTATSGQDRAAIVEFLRKELLGPREGRDELVGNGTPFDRYMLGVLYPQSIEADGVTEVEGDEATASPTRGGRNPKEVEYGGDDASLDLSSQMMPCAMGISFLCSERSPIRVRPRGATYEGPESSNSDKGPWKRRDLDSGDPEGILLQPGTNDISTLEGRSRVHVTWLHLRSGRQLLTVTLTNTQLSSGRAGRHRVEDCIFQAGISCRPERGMILPYPSLLAIPRDDEEEDLALLYRNSPVFAAGHGCAPAWDGEEENGHPDWVRTESLPTSEVHDQTHLELDSKVLQLSFLCSPETDDGRLISELRSFLHGYRAWVGSEARSSSELPDCHQEAAARMITRLGEAITRMERGILLLEQDQTAMRSFRLANLAMLMQMVHGRLTRSTRPLRSPLTLPRDRAAYLAEATPRWRPFQLAFLLLVLPGLVESGSPDREIVDLIWFPTGGGKTEAYLAAAAFEILHRRKVHGERGGGTSVLTRYTLRMLTAQQFQRTSLLTCALERIRQEERDLGDSPISIGLWVGGSTTPNNFREAHQQFQRMLEDADHRHPFLVDRCPWCGTELVPASASSPDDPGLGIHSTATSFQFRCPEDACPFHERLPLQVVDDGIYQAPPTILLATVDKLARLTWIDQGGHLLTGGGRFLPPGMIIQDELHLLSGPLGTMVGLYETAISALISQSGTRPKVIASTATIRRASEQVRGLFNSPVALFPPSGLDAGYSYFASPDISNRGRLYVGVMSQDHTPETALVRLSAALAQAPCELTLSAQGKDAYWTQVIYHNSLRELGKTEFKLLDDIPKRVEVIASGGQAPRSLDSDVIDTLTSQVAPEHIPAILRRMDTPCTSPRALSVLLCTNMLSVGIDVGRLGLMVVNGQPKTTSEYIQATSRVGRSRDSQGRPDRPGLVMVLLAWNKARDRSHYETFPGYHAAFYSHVEPTSVTPFASPARQRALHAAIVILLRHLGHLAGSDGAHRFSPGDPGVSEVMRLILDRCRDIDPMEGTATQVDLEERVTEWAKAVEKAQDSGCTLRYESRSRQDLALLRQFESSCPDGWPTLNSMRNVDRECRLTVFGEA